MRISRRAFELYEGLISLGAIIESEAVEYSPLGNSLGISDGANFPLWLRELVDAGLVERRLPTNINESIAYYVSDLEPNGIEVGDSPSMRRPSVHRSLLRLDLDVPERVEIQQKIADLIEVVRGTNDAEIKAEEKQRVLAGLAGADALWRSPYLDPLQIRIGVILAIDDGIELLGKAGKAVAFALLIDIIKAYVRVHTGVDLDKP